MTFGDAVPSRGMAPRASICAWKTRRPSRICCLTASVRTGDVARVETASRADSSAPIARVAQDRALFPVRSHAV